MAGYSEVLVVCDCCDKTERLTFREGDMPLDHVALERLRERLTKEGWSDVSGDELCPRCVGQP